MAKLPKDLNELRKTLSFRGGWVVNRNWALVTVQYDALADLGEFDTHVFAWERDKGWSKAFEVEWLASRVAVDNFGTVACMSPLGMVYAREPDGTEWYEMVDRTSRGPRTSGPLRGFSVLSGGFHCCGMARRVYRRIEPDEWNPIDDDVAIDPAKDTVVGFNAMAEVAQNCICAVGFEGEVWLRHGSSWSNVNTPTNVVLHAVSATSGGGYVACGQLGVILAGEGENVELVKQYIVEDDLWGCAEFGGTIFLAAADTLLALRDGSVAAVDTGLPDGWSFRHLHAADGVLWSFGSRHVAHSLDGIRWHDATPRPGHIAGA